MDELTRYKLLDGIKQQLPGYSDLTSITEIVDDKNNTITFRLTNRHGIYMPATFKVLYKYNPKFAKRILTKNKVVKYAAKTYSADPFTVKIPNDFKEELIGIGKMRSEYYRNLVNDRLINFLQREFDLPIYLFGQLWGISTELVRDEVYEKIKDDCILLGFGDPAATIAISNCMKELGFEEQEITPYDNVLKFESNRYFRAFSYKHNDMCSVYTMLKIKGY
ncbi:MAG: hypothetical protein ACI4V7_06475 [Succinivibrionaceae bacterium]